MSDRLLMYDELAPWWPLLSAPEDYREEAELYRRQLLEAGAPGLREVSRRLNPDCEHVAGDMRDVRLGRTFDAEPGAHEMFVARRQEAP